MYRTNHPLLPISLQRKRNKRVLIRVIPCILLLFATVSSLVLWGDLIFPFEKSYGGGSMLFAKIFVYAFLLALPFLITGVPFKLIDRSFCGTVKNVEIKDGLGSTAGNRWFYPKNDIILTIETDDGKTLMYTALSLGVRVQSSATDTAARGNISDHEERYRVGDRVYKYYGFKHLFTCQNDERNAVYCIECGTACKSSEKKCWSCGSELIYKYTLK